MNNIIKRTWKQNGMVQIEDLRGQTFQNESGGHTFVIRGEDEDGNQIALSGSPAGVFLRPDNTDQALTCSITNGMLYATLPAACYDVPGRAGITIYLTSGEQKTALYAAMVSVGRTSTGTVAPGTTADVVDLINRINEVVATIPPDYSALSNEVIAIKSELGQVPSGKTAQGQITDIQNALGIVPTGKTAQGQIADLQNAMGEVPEGKTVQGQITDLKAETTEGLNAKIDISNFHYRTDSGDFFQIDALSGFAKNAEINVLPEQDLHGYGFAWAGGNGKNMLPLTLENVKTWNTSSTGTWSGNTYTKQGIAYTFNTDNDGNIVSITLNGTTASDQYSQIKVGEINFPAGTYYADHGNYAQQNTIDLYANSTPDAGSQYNINAPITFTYNSAKSGINVYLYIYAGKTLNNQTVYPIICSNSQTDKSFAPYSNICQIGGYTGTDLTIIGKNLFNIGLLEQGGWDTGAIGFVPAATWVCVTNGYIKVKGGRTYTINAASATSGKTARVTIAQFTTNDGITKCSDESGWQTLPYTFDIPDGIKYIRVGFQYSDESTVTPSSFNNIQLEMGYDPTEYQAYIGRNIFHHELVQGGWNDGAIGVLPEATWVCVTKGYVAINPSKKYTINVIPAASGKSPRVTVAQFTVDDGVTHCSNESGWNAVPYTFEASSTTKFIRIGFRYSDDSTVLPDSFKDIQVEMGSVATEYERYVKNKFDIEFPAGEGTVYGAEIIVNEDFTGKLIINKGKVLMDQIEWSVYGTGTSQVFYKTISGLNIKVPGNNNSMANIYCSHYRKTDYNHISNGMIAVSTTKQICFKDFRYDNATDLVAGIAGAILVFDLNTPISYDLTEQQIRTFLGINTVYISTEGNVVLTYPYDYDKSLIDSALGTGTPNKMGLALANKRLVMGEAYIGKFVAVDSDTIAEESNAYLGYSKVSVNPGDQYYVSHYLFSDRVYGVIFTDASGKILQKEEQGNGSLDYGTSELVKNAYIIPKNAAYMYVNYAHMGIEYTRPGFENPFYIYKLDEELHRDMVDLSDCTYDVGKAVLYNGSIITNNTYNYIKIPVSANDVYEITGTFSGNAIADALFVDSNGAVIYSGRYNMTNNTHYEAYEVAVPANTGITHMIVNYHRVGGHFEISKLVKGARHLELGNQKLSILGDSRSALHAFAYTWCVHMRALCGFDMVNIDGVGSTNIVSGDYSFISRYESIPLDTNVIAVYGGVNDFFNNVPLGTIEDTTSSTFYGGLDVLINGIQGRYPNAVLFFITPEQPSTMTTNSLGLKLDDYVNAIIEVCRKHKVPYLNHFETCGINVNIQAKITTLFPDGVHANAKGNMMYAREFAGFINSIFG